MRGAVGSVHAHGDVYGNLFPMAQPFTVDNGNVPSDDAGRARGDVDRAHISADAMDVQMLGNNSAAAGTKRFYPL